MTILEKMIPGHFEKCVHRDDSDAAQSIPRKLARDHAVGQMMVKKGVAGLEQGQNILIDKAAPKMYWWLYSWRGLTVSCPMLDCDIQKMNKAISRGTAQFGAQAFSTAFTTYKLDSLPPIGICRDWYLW